MMFTNKSLNIFIHFENKFYSWTTIHTKDEINSLNKKIKFLKKNKTSNIKKVYRFFYNFINLFNYELINGNKKYEELREIILKLKPEKFEYKVNNLSDKLNLYYELQYSSLVSSILSDLSLQIENYHIYAAILKGKHYKKIEKNLTEQKALHIFDFRCENDYISYCKFNRINNKLINNF